MNPIALPFKTMVFVCTNSRETGARISCAGDGRCGETILERLRAHIKNNKLERVVRISKSGCQEACENGPVVSIFPQNIMLHNVTEEDLPNIISTHLDPSLYR